MNAMANMTTSPHVGRRSVLRLAVAGLITLLVGLVAAGFWTVGQAQYFNEYCSMHSPNRPELKNYTDLPNGQPVFPESFSGGPAYMDGPVTVVCEYDYFPATREFAPGWFIIAVILAAVVIAIGVGTFRWAWHPVPPKETTNSEPK
jgi:hypothetical protein